MEYHRHPHRSGDLSHDLPFEMVPYQLNIGRYYSLSCRCCCCPYHGHPDGQYHPLPIELSRSPSPPTPPLPYYPTPPPSTNKWSTAAQVGSATNQPHKNPTQTSQTHAKYSNDGWIATYPEFYNHESTFGHSPDVIRNAFEIGLQEGLIKRVGWREFDFSGLRERIGTGGRMCWALNGEAVNGSPLGGRRKSHDEEHLSRRRKDFEREDNWISEKDFRARGGNTHIRSETDWRRRPYGIYTDGVYSIQGGRDGKRR